ncbi:MAG: hypothetical protein M0P76_05500 [Candidatus Pacebacteria bacterium]|jgi:hypothetical protein|nr:hypothetical protein [Candidatus Paceibacterota bacterium]
MSLDTFDLVVRQVIVGASAGLLLGVAFAKWFFSPDYQNIVLFATMTIVIVLNVWLGFKTRNTAE